VREELRVAVDAAREEHEEVHLPLPVQDLESALRVKDQVAIAPGDPPGRRVVSARLQLNDGLT
jgi:hypothetical protein